MNQFQTKYLKAQMQIEAVLYPLMNLVTFLKIMTSKNKNSDQKKKL